MPKKAAACPPEKLSLFEALVATLPNVDRKGAAMPYTSVNGHMFSFMTKDGQLALRLEHDQLEAFLTKHKTERCVQHGRVMQEYVIVPDSLLKKTARLKPYFIASFEYVRSLKPKPTKRKAPPAKKNVAGSAASSTVGTRSKKIGKKKATVKKSATRKASKKQTTASGQVSKPRPAKTSSAKPVKKKPVKKKPVTKKSAPKKSVTQKSARKNAQKRST